MAVILLLLTLLVAAGKFADFLIGSQGSRRGKDRLVDFYVQIGEGDWWQVFRWSGDAMARFIDRTFGEPALSSCYLRRVVAYSVALTAAVCLFIWLPAIGGPVYDLPFDDFGPAYLIVPATAFLCNIVADLISWTLVRWFFHKLREGSGRRVGVLTLLAVAQAYLTFAAIYFALMISTFAAMSFAEGEWEQFRQVFSNGDWLEVMSTLFADPFSGEAWQLAPAGMNAYSLGVLIPPALFVGSVLLCALAYGLRPLVQKPLALIIQRAEESQKGIFSLGAGAIAALAGMLVVAQKALT